MNQTLAWTFLAVGVSSSAPVAAQCDPHWLPGNGIPGADIYVAASTSWDPDGPGPQPELLVIAGGFQTLGDQRLRGLAAWNGQTWRELDPYSEGDMYSITALAVYQGDLICAGNFGTLSGVPMNNIARFDGRNWHPLGEGITGSIGYGWVLTLKVVGDQLLVGGFFDTAGGSPAVNVAAWDGATETWSALGDGLSTGQYYEGVFGFTEYQGELVAAGDFTMSGPSAMYGVARFDGTQWQPFPPVDSFFPFEAGTFQGDLVVGGIYYDFGSTDPEYWGDTIVVRWDEDVGDWEPLGGTLGSPMIFGIEKLTEFQGELYVSGDFVTDIWDVNDPYGLMRRWDGEDWQIVGEGIGGLYWFQPVVQSLEVHQGRLIACGAFSHADGKGALNLAAWDGEHWDHFGSGTNNRVTRFVEFQNGVVAAGEFDTIEGVDVPRMALWDGSAWSALPQPAPQWAYPLGVLHGELLIVSNAEKRLYLLHDGAWQAFGDPFEVGFLTAMAVYRGKLVIGGSFAFTSFYDEPISGVAQWDGHHWRPLGEGVAGTLWGTPVRDMEVYKGKLIVAGGLETAGGQPANNIASWDGRRWETLGEGLTEPEDNTVVWALEVYQDELVATGQFFVAGGVPARDIAAWDGQSWHALGTNGDSTLTNWGQALLAHGDDLYVGGEFWGAGGVEVHGIARWDGEEWHAMDGGVDPQWYPGVHALARCGDTLFVGGTFVQVGTGISSFLARWGCD